MARDTARMGRAEKLVVLLADEGVRWEETVGILNNELTQLVGNVFLSAACCNTVPFLQMTPSTEHLGKSKIR